ncbi:hypothetical protein J6590_026415 [Homalodisca vitripennis]|nr:hypothetical protein J6590_026415 [Homalodisca vitripennis]
MALTPKHVYPNKTEHRHTMMFKCRTIPPSSDLTPLDYFLWGNLKDNEAQPIPQEHVPNAVVRFITGHHIAMRSEGNILNLYFEISSLIVLPSTCNSSVVRTSPLDQRSNVSIQEQVLNVLNVKKIKNIIFHQGKLVLSRSLWHNLESNEEPGNDFQTTTNDGTGGLLAGTGSLSGHSSKQQPRLTLLDSVNHRIRYTASLEKLAFRTNHHLLLRSSHCNALNSLNAILTVKQARQLQKLNSALM